MRTFFFHPADVLIFRDGSSFNREDAGLASARTLFPPLPTTMVGAVRAMLARRLGWKGGDWEAPSNQALDLVRLVGSGDSLAKGLEFEGPIVCLQGKPVFPPPADLAVPGGLQCQYVGIVEHASQKVGVIRLRPAAKGFSCDLGPEVSLPEPATALGQDLAAEPLARVWLTAAGLAKALAGREADIVYGDLVAIDPDSDARSWLWARERRIGLARDYERRVAVTGQLYTAEFARLGPEVTIAVTVTGEEAIMAEIARRSGGPATGDGGEIVPLGGEGRWALVDEMRDQPFASDLAALRPATAPAAPGGEYRVVALTPIQLDQQWPVPGATNPALPGTLASACCDRPMVAGGWSSFGARQASRPNTPLIPAGACLFMAGGSGAPSRTRIGERTEWGFGAIAWGNGW